MDKKIINKNPRKFRLEKSTSSFRFPHIVKEEKKEVWVYIKSGFPTTLAVGPLMEIHYPEYKSCLNSSSSLLTPSAITSPLLSKTGASDLRVD